MKIFNHSEVLVLGAGRSGCSAAELLAREGLRVTMLDGAGDHGQCDALKPLGVKVLFDVLDLSDHLEGPTAAVVSPGIPWEHDWLVACRAAGMEVLSELEFGSRFIKGRILAITGSLGKSTCTALSTYALNHSGVKAVAGGNFGIPVCELAMNHGTADWYVLEVSSFQLEGINRFKPDVALLMNLYPNHLDRHRTLAKYLGLKMRLFENMGAGDSALLPAALADDILWLVSREVERKTFGAAQGDVNWQAEFEALSATQSEECRDAQVFATWPKENLAAWLAAMRTCGVEDEVLCRTVKEFKGLPHRMERLPEVGGVKIINDSKSTCLQATRGAIESSPGGLHLIAGGRAKGEDDLSLKEVLEARKVNVYLIGEASDSWYAAWKNSVPCRLCRSLDVAVNESLSAARAGETVILSPGCASFDQYTSFEARGNAFKKITEQWVMQQASLTEAG